MNSVRLLPLFSILHLVLFAPALRLDSGVGFLLQAAISGLNLLLPFPAQQQTRLLLAVQVRVIQVSIV
jgi:hypothetical protein